MWNLPTTKYKDGNELHTQPTSVQFQHSKAMRMGPRRSTHPHPVKRTWRNTDRSLRVRVLKLFFQQNHEYTNTQQVLPDQGYT